MCAASEQLPSLTSILVGKDWILLIYKFSLPYEIVRCNDCECKMVCKPWLGVFSARATWYRQRVVVVNQVTCGFRSKAFNHCSISSHSSCICFFLQIERNLFLITAKSSIFSGFPSLSIRCYLCEKLPPPSVTAVHNSSPYLEPEQEADLDTRSEWPQRCDGEKSGDNVYEVISNNVRAGCLGWLGSC